MILIKCDRHGVVSELADSDIYTQLMETLECLTEELESDGIFLIKETATKNLGRTLEFASVEHGWECVLILAHGYAKNIGSKNDDDDD